jgi:hypothetical protein
MARRAERREREACVGAADIGDEGKLLMRVAHGSGGDWHGSGSSWELDDRGTRHRLFRSISLWLLCLFKKDSAVNG